MICLDAGHGGNDDGATFPREEIKEKDIALEVQKITEHFLIHEGIDYRVTRNRDRYVPLSIRADTANYTNADIFVSIHCNFVPSTQVNGYEVWHYSGSEEGEKLADCLRKKYTLNMKDRGLKSSEKAADREEEFVVLEETEMPAALIELGFLSNEGDRRHITSHSGIYQAGQSIFEGIKSYLEVG